MRFELAASVLASLLVADPVLAQIQRQKKQRIMDSEHLEELEDTNKLHLGQFHQRNNKFSRRRSDDIHYKRKGARMKKDRIMDSEHLIEMEGSNKLHHGQLHQRTKQKRTVPSHKKNLRTNKNAVVDSTLFEKEIADVSSLSPQEVASLPDVGILAHDYEQDTALDRNLQNNKRKKKNKKNKLKNVVAQSCFQEIPFSLRKISTQFEQPYCDQMDDGTYMAYWNIKDEKSFFLGGYCSCAEQCGKARGVSRCCAKGCMTCGANGSSPHAKCGQFSANNPP